MIIIKQSKKKQLIKAVVNDDTSTFAQWDDLNMYLNVYVPVDDAYCVSDTDIVLTKGWHKFAADYNPNAEFKYDFDKDFALTLKCRLPLKYVYETGNIQEWHHFPTSEDDWGEVDTNNLYISADMYRATNWIFHPMGGTIRVESKSGQEFPGATLILPTPIHNSKITAVYNESLIDFKYVTNNYYSEEEYIPPMDKDILTEYKQYSFLGLHTISIKAKDGYKYESDDISSLITVQPESMKKYLHKDDSYYYLGITDELRGTEEDKNFIDDVTITIPDPVPDMKNITFVAPEYGATFTTHTIQKQKTTMITSADLPDTTPDTHYAFKGWNPAFSDHVVTTDETYTAEFELIASKVSFNYGGAYEDYFVRVDQGTKIPTDSLPKDKHNQWILLGWYDNAEFTGSPIDLSTWTMPTPSTPITFYAKWDTEAAKVLVQFTATGGTIDTPSVVLYKRDTDGMADVNGVAHLTTNQIPSPTPSTGYNPNKITWTPKIPEVTDNITTNTTYNVTWGKFILEIVIPPHGFESEDENPFTVYPEGTYSAGHGESISVGTVEIKSNYEFTDDVIEQFDMMYQYYGVNTVRETPQKVVISGTANVPSADMSLKSKLPMPELKPQVTDFGSLEIGVTNFTSPSSGGGSRNVTSMTLTFTTMDLPTYDGEFTIDGRPFNFINGSALYVGNLPYGDTTLTLEHLPVGNFNVYVKENPEEYVVAVTSNKHVIEKDKTAEMLIHFYGTTFDIASLAITPPTGGWVNNTQNFFKGLIRFTQPIPDDVAANYEMYVTKSVTGISMNSTWALETAAGYSGINFSDSMVLQKDSTMSYNVKIRKVDDENSVLCEKTFTIPTPYGSGNHSGGTVQSLSVNDNDSFIMMGKHQLFDIDKKSEITTPLITDWVCWDKNDNIFIESGNTIEWKIYGIPNPDSDGIDENMIDIEVLGNDSIDKIDKMVVNKRIKLKIYSSNSIKGDNLVNVRYQGNIIKSINVYIV